MAAEAAVGADSHSARYRSARRVASAFCAAGRGYLAAGSAAFRVLRHLPPRRRRRRDTDCRRFPRRTGWTDVDHGRDEVGVDFRHAIVG